ncbi:MAG: OmpA family protein, partial [Candidatus Latescibacteria bacterium]|nr:OmpA family protein [Candidatus Latescibacterota bacterium]
MNDTPPNKDPDDGLDALRSLLLKPEKEQIEQLQTRIENEDLRAEDVSEVLAEAFLIRLGRDDKLSRALTPTIESALESSTKRNTRVLVDAISPLMGPAIRRSILQTISGMIQSMNATLDQSFSVQGFKWRWEAFRTGKSFGEIVMLHTLVYQVEQVFLIHKETGLLLQHVTRQAIESMDGDMVSGMLTAIQDFVQDSFVGHPDEALHTMQVGELTVWIEQGPQAVLAGVLRGNPPTDLHAIFQEALENVHLEQKKAFEEFEGDAVYFEGSRRHLEECLRSQFRAEVAKRKKRVSPLMWIGLFAVLAALGFWAYVGIQAQQRWDGYLSRLDAAPGIVVIENGYRGGRYFVSGLRDPLAVDPTSFLPDWSLSPESVVGKWAPYQ